MKNIPKTISLLAFGLVFFAAVAHAQLGSSTGTTTVSVTIGPQAGLTITNNSTPLTASGSNFNAAFTGSTTLTYFIRTSVAGGSGWLGLSVTSDFSPAGGPSVANPPTSGDELNYTCTVDSPGTGCTGTQHPTTYNWTTVGTFGSDAHTGPGGNSATVTWNLTNDPKYKTGTYSSTVTFTIGAM